MLFLLDGRYRIYVQNAMNVECMHVARRIDIALRNRRHLQIQQTVHVTSQLQLCSPVRWTRRTQECFIPCLQVTSASSLRRETTPDELLATIAQSSHSTLIVISITLLGVGFGLASSPRRGRVCSLRCATKTL